MEVGTEISQKIRSAIKAKLLELGSYVDDELPDYIMVMVANKKTRSQMNSDLCLFLGTNTNAFTEWLHGLLEKLQTIRIDSDKSSSKQAKTDKHKSSKEKKREKSQKRESSGKKSSKDRDKKKAADSVNDSNVDSNKHTSDHGEAEKSKSSSSSSNAHSQSTNIENESKKSSIIDSLNSNVIVETQANERNKSIIEDFEDVRQLLVTHAPEDELAEELETTEVEAVKSRKVLDVVEPEVASCKDACSFDASHLNYSANQRNTTRSQSPENRIVKEASISRKRKTPTSVVATISRRDETEEEYDPHNPAVGSVASVVRVTARKSSIPPLLQANRLLLLKAMTEAEQSVAAKKRVSVTKPVSRDNSPAEVYSPKRKQSDKSHDRDSPPLYIPSKKESVNRHGAHSTSAKNSEIRVLTRNDARHVINKESNRGVMSRSHSGKISKTVDENRESSNRVTHSRSPERSRRHRENDKNEREVRSDKGVTGDKNFQITCHVSPETRQSLPHSNERKRRHSPSPEPKNLQVTFSPKTVVDSRSTTARLGKIIVERIDPDDVRETVSSRSSGGDARERIDSGGDVRATVSSRLSNQVTSTRQRDAREDIIAKARQSKSKEKIFQKPSSGRVISSLGREAVQKQCEAAVISVKAAGATSKINRKMSPDSRVVECDTQSVDDEEVKEDVKESKEVESSSLKMMPSFTEVLDVRARSPGSVGDDDDLSKMIDEDLGPELLDDTNNNFTLDLDIDDDLSNVLGVTEDDTIKADIREHGKDEKRSGTRFIVTLDGVDERQFHAEDNSRVFEKFKRPPIGSAPAIVVPVVATSAQLQQSQGLFVDHLVTQSKQMLQMPPQQVPMIVAAVPSKLTPPKIQPFSISLKDSDDEHDEKEGKSSAIVPEYYQPAKDEVSALKKAKMSERCKFWPACAAGASCEFHHPTTHCKTFPNCKFGDKCLFIHPNCRFDSKCARSDCPYTHTSRRPTLSGTTMIAIPQQHFVFSTVRPKLVAPTTTQTVCRYFPNCQNVNCLFLHPKHCKFGIACKSQSCPFYHPPNPGWHKLKWQASGGQVRAEVTTPQSVVKEEYRPTSPKHDPVPHSYSPTSPNYSTAVSSTSK